MSWSFAAHSGGQKAQTAPEGGTAEPKQGARILGPSEPADTARLPLCVQSAVPALRPSLHAVSRCRGEKQDK